MDEVWKQIIGYENYKISNYGRVINATTNFMLKPQNNGKGYLHVVLYNSEHEPKTIMVHRLVAMYFIPNPLNLPQVNHIDECKINNCVTNLEWITSEDNINHGTHNQRVGENNPRRIPIYSVDIHGNIQHFKSARDASRYYKNEGIKITPAGISKALNGDIYTYKDLAWFKECDLNGVKEYKSKFQLSGVQNKRPVYCISDDGETYHFDSINSASSFCNHNGDVRYHIRKSIANKIKFNGYYWHDAV